MSSENLVLINLSLTDKCESRKNHLKISSITFMLHNIYEKILHYLTLHQEDVKGKTLLFKINMMVKEKIKPSHT